MSCQESITYLNQRCQEFITYLNQRRKIKPRPSTATILITILLFIFVASVFFTLAFTVGKKVSLFLNPEYERKQDF